MDFLDFLIKSKKNTYASSKITDKLNKDGSKELIFEENEYKYVDRYFGYNPFSGLEVVFRQDEYIWSMSYYGRIKSNEVSEKEVYSFLKQALLNVNENFPLRGPSVFKKEDFSYFCDYNGSYEDFKGTERIEYKDKVIYKCEFIGGFISKKLI
ncbi:MAG: DUF5680 domain-containing protein [Candidatus ainarchaeum sp.]|nr:DUF5680 domain-containing protein [Candidatus ainarchaeum sp.]MDD3976024.1 DUF5680 domain-containing protein [Candidatus ainarchaeum sp.]